MQIVYLDQNKWIDLARAVKQPEAHPKLHKVLECLVRNAEAGRVSVPLTATNIYETHKINDPERRGLLAYVQATLSQGWVFRGRHKRLEVEIVDVLRAAYGLPPLTRDENWFLSDVFFESTLEWDDPRFVGGPSKKVVEHIRSNPPHFLFEYLMNTPEDIRTAAVAKFSEGSAKLIEGMEKRRARDASEALSMRRRIQGVLLTIGEIELIVALIKKAGIDGHTDEEILRDQCQRIVTNAPTYFIEREIALKIEAQTRPLQENDLRDMQTFCAVVRYADVVVAENQFSNLAKQASLDKKYGTQLMTDLLALPACLPNIIDANAETATTLAVENTADG